jgi:hypothetical protein
MVQELSDRVQSYLLHDKPACRCVTLGVEARTRDAETGEDRIGVDCVPRRYHHGEPYQDAHQRGWQLRSDYVSHRVVIDETGRVFVGPDQKFLVSCHKAASNRRAGQDFSGLSIDVERWLFLLFRAPYIPLYILMNF